MMQARIAAFLAALLTCPLSASAAEAPVYLDSAGKPREAAGVFAPPITRTRLTCTLPAYASGGNAVCANQAGGQTTTACAASTACQIAAANTSRKTAFLMNRTTGVTIDIGYSATVAPGTGIGLDGPGSAGGQGGSLEENPAHFGAYFAASPSAATLVIVQGQ